MEKDVCISSGISRFLHESTFQLSDVYQIDVCGGCGNIISAEKSCRVCQDNPNPASKIGTVDIPYCAKLLFQVCFYNFYTYYIRNYKALVSRFLLE